MSKLEVTNESKICAVMICASDCAPESLYNLLKD